MRYQRCKVDELKAFAAARHIDVTYKRLKKSIIIDILKKADKSRPFHRFLDLPPEIRNMICEYSLKVLPGQTTCHPQILATCKQINREASGFLYDDNVITIEIFSDRVETCGMRCGPYNPRSLFNYLINEEPSEDYRVDKIQWPDFLRRARSIHVKAPEDTWFCMPNSKRWYMTYDRRISNICDVFDSLCSELSSNHRCRNISLDLGTSDPAYLTTAAIRRMHYPMRLLGLGVMKNSPGGDILYLHDITAYQRATALRQGWRLPKAALINIIDEASNRMVLAITATLRTKAKSWTSVACLEAAASLGLSTDEALDDALADRLKMLRERATHYIREKPEWEEEYRGILLLAIELRAS